MRRGLGFIGILAACALAFWLGRRSGEPGPTSASSSKAASKSSVASKSKSKSKRGSRSSRAVRYKSKVKAKNAKAYFKEDRPEIDIETLPPRTIPIIDVHEHAQTLAEAKRLLRWMDHFNIKLTCLQSASIYTFTLDKQYGFERFKENNEELLRIKDAYAGRFCAFVTVNPTEEGNVALLKDYAKRGADGLKLFLGHGAGTGKGKFHSMPLDDPRMMPIYAWAERTQFPLLFHINFIKYFEELVRVMEAHPYLRICVPHFGLHKNTAKRLARLSWLLERYPNFYLDMSYGHHDFHKEGFESLSKWLSRSQAFIRRHADRLLFGADMVLEKTKDDPYIEENLRSYMQWLEMPAFRFHMVPERTMKGMGMSPEVVRSIYWDAPHRYLLLDADGKLPDRSTGWPPKPVPGLPPLTAAVTPLGPADILPPGR